MLSASNSIIILSKTIAFHSTSMFVGVNYKYGLFTPTPFLSISSKSVVQEEVSSVLALLGIIL